MYHYTSPNSEYIVKIITEVIKILDIAQEKFLVLLSDAAKYMTYAVNKLKDIYPNLFPFSCISHLYHNIAMKVSSFFPKVNFLIVSIKSALTKCIRRRMSFESIGLPPDTIVTRWGSWLKATRWCSTYFSELKKIVIEFEDGGKIIENAKAAVLDDDVRFELLELETKYLFLIDLIDKSESINYSVEMAINDINSINILNDKCNINSYID